VDIDPKLFDYCTPRQREVLEAIIANGGCAPADRALTAGHSLSSATLRRVRNKAAKQGYAPGHFESGTAPGFSMGKVTVQRNAEGMVERTWERQSPDRSLEALRAAIDGMAGEIAPVAPVAPPAASMADLLTLYTFTDYHVGMLAWHREGGDDWDTAIAEETGVRAMQALTAGSPNAERAIVNIQGDFIHWDGLIAVTPQHGHILDADSRFGKVVDVSIRLVRKLVGLALEKHEHVTLLVCEGNHDIASSLWLRKLFAALYENEPRITVHNSELPYYAIQWGKVMLGFHHGHLKKNDQLPALFAAQFRQMWGECSKVAIHTGHRHHREVKEHPGAEVIQHPTLAARDAFAARGGWWSERKIIALTYHREFGEVGSNSVTPEMLA
jgi:hypothetical protein